MRKFPGLVGIVGKGVQYGDVTQPKAVLPVFDDFAHVVLEQRTRRVECVEIDKYVLPDVVSVEAAPETGDPQLIAGQHH